MENKNFAVYLGIGAIVVVIIFAIWLATSGSDEKEMVEGRQPEVKTPDVIPQESDKSGTLDSMMKEEMTTSTVSGDSGETMSSDDFIRQKAERLRMNNVSRNWLKLDNLAARLVSLVDTISRGSVPVDAFRFFAPKKPFQELTFRGDPALNAAVYRRYQPVANLIAGLNPERVVEVLEAVYPVLEEEYETLGLPEGNGNFQKKLDLAMENILAIDVTDSGVPLVRDSVTFRFADEALEKSSSLVKLFQRMGPSNTQKIQDKVKKIKELM